MFDLVVCMKESTKNMKKQAKAAKTSSKSSAKKLSSKEKNAKKSLNKNKIFLIGAAVLGGWLILMLILAGVVGYGLYRNYKQSDDIVTTINSLNDSFAPIEDDYEEILSDINGIQTTQTSAELADTVIKKIEDVDRDLAELEKQVQDVNNSDLDNYTSAITEYISAMQDLNQPLVALLDFGACINTFNSEAAIVGQALTEVDPEDLDAIVELYQSLNADTVEFADCLENSQASDNSAVQTHVESIRQLDQELQIIIFEISEGTVSEEIADSFFAQANKVQNDGNQIASELTTQIRDKVSAVDSTITQIKAEERSLSDEFELDFE